MTESRQQRRARERASAKTSSARQDRVPAISEQELLDGLETIPRTRIRLATGADIADLRPLVELAGVELDPVVADAVRDERMAAALRLGLRSGHDALIQDVATAACAVTNGDLSPLFLRTGLPLVAEYDGDVVGTLLAYPPARVISRYYQAAAASGPREQQKVVLGAAISLIKIKALGVAEAAQGHRVGSTLLRTATQVYRHCGFQILFGQIPAERALEPFYRQAGFEVGTHGDGLDLWSVFGYPGGVHADQGERLFSKRL